MIDLLQDMGLKELLAPYLKSADEVQKLRGAVSDLNLKVNKEIMDINRENVKNSSEKDKMIEDLLAEKERLIEEKNAIFMEKIKLETKGLS